MGLPGTRHDDKAEIALLDPRIVFIKSEVGNILWRTGAVDSSKMLQCLNLSIMLEAMIELVTVWG